MMTRPSTDLRRAARRGRAAFAFALALLISLVLPPSAMAGEEHEHEDWIEHDSCLHGRLDRLERRGGLRAADAVAFDPETGADRRNFPRDRHVDYEHMRVKLRFDDLNDRMFTATEDLIVRPITDDVRGLTLDALDLEVKSVRLDGRPVEHFHDGKKLTLRFASPLPADRSSTLTFEYICREPWDGMFFTPYRPESPDYHAEVHTQGQTETNRHWFIAHDFPNERMTTELIVDVPSGLGVSGNGRLVEKADRGGRTIWRYLQDKPHVSYLVTLVIGTFEVVEIPHDRVPMQVWVPRGDADKVMPTFGMTGDMIDVFEDVFGLPYPWDRYDQLCVKNFGAGGMENTSATTLYPTAALDDIAIADRDLQALIAHELAHQWTGDLITCKSWAHIWLNEGWATYGESLWYEQSEGVDSYLDDCRNNMRVARRDTVDKPYPMVSPIYETPGDTFRRPANPYPKGASVLHMLRKKLGDEVFFEGVRLYMKRHAYGVVETSDFRYALEEVSGLGLEGFFHQWCYRPGSPALDVNVDYDGATRELVVAVEQTQTMDARTPAFRFTLPVHVEVNGGWSVHPVEVSTKTTRFRTTLDGAPTVVAIDPDLHVLKTMTVTKPRGLWFNQVDAGPSIIATHQALEALGQYDDAESVATLARVAGDATRRHTVRRTAVDTLADLASPRARQAMLELFDADLAEPKVRVRVIAGLQKQDADVVADRLMKAAGGDRSYACRVEAIEGLAELRVESAGDLVCELTNFESQHDQVRRAAIRALARMQHPRGLELALANEVYGRPDRARAAIVGAIGDLAGQDQDAARKRLLTLLHDPEWRTVNAAIDALAKVGGDEAKAALERMEASHRSPEVRERCARALKRMGTTTS